MLLVVTFIYHIITLNLARKRILKEHDLCDLKLLIFLYLNVSN